VIWSTTQAAEHLPVRMPRLCSAERLSESMVDEIFQLIVIAGRVCDEHGYVTKS